MRRTPVHAVTIQRPVRLPWLVETGDGGARISASQLARNENANGLEVESRRVGFGSSVLSVTRLVSTPRDRLVYCDACM